MGISYVSEMEEFQPYCLDIYLTEWHLCVEVDGPGHSPKHDAKRDGALLTLGCPTLRLKTQERGWQGKAMARIEDFIVEHATSAPERIRLWQSLRSQN